MHRFLGAKSLTTAVTAALGLIAASGTAGAFEAKISGHVNRMIMRVDDGQQSKVLHADNINSQTRFRFVGTQEVTPGLTAGLNWEVGWTSNPSSSLSMTSPSVAATLNERHTDLFFKGKWGTVSFGQGDGAANGGMEVDLSGTTVIQYSGFSDIGGGFTFRNKVGGAAGSTIGATLSNLDFESRYDRLRYDTPALGPLKFAASSGTTSAGFDATEFAAILGSDFAAGKLAGALGWSEEKRGGVAGDEQTLGGSISFLARNGTNISFAHARKEDDTLGKPDHKFTYVKLGHQWGKHAVAIDYGQGKHMALAGDKSRAYGIGYVWTPEKWAELYAGFKVHKLERPGADFDNISFLSAGTRIKF